ncbi:MAG: Holliday junction resolvase RuvX [Anaerolineaceae bacterium]|nr:Holliday junction resolvase RuvX [Anaerolineaceae bacterium]
MKLLAIDHGERRLGLATCDSSGLVARELTILPRRTRREDFAAIQEHAAREGARALLVGLPLNDLSARRERERCTIVRRWAGRLARATGLPVTLWDEQLSSIEAQQLARARKRGPRAPIDDLAARVILQSYLDALRDGLAGEPEQIMATSPPDSQGV